MVPSKVSEVKLTYANKVKACDRVKIKWSKDAAILFKESWDYDTIDAFETFKAMYLNRANQVLGIVTISTGGIAAALADPTKVFCGAIKCLAAGIILCHNHPSGSLMPSDVDKKLTERMKHAGEILGITILDHVIISREGYRSMTDQGEL
ncbi:JAB domain-containing protein [Aquimarina macrocephali]|uniref:JAB domain-containing protein n=1 Tax=Aquimarina macrocephali TaxID=666563 RepID=UPI0019D32C3B|nr:JAB domain-containing protein [Aquimarina macrocephali]